MNFFIGIDPGKTGAVVTIDGLERIQHEYCFDCQDSIDENSGHLDNIKYSLGGSILGCCLEKVHAMPKQGVKSVWTFAENFSMWKTLLTVQCLPFELVTPQAWMKGLIKPSDHVKLKKRGLTVCRRKYPKDPLFRLEKHDGRADAALMAVHIKRKVMGVIS